jgi:hypothetical protein
VSAAETSAPDDRVTEPGEPEHAPAIRWPRAIDTVGCPVDDFGSTVYLMNQAAREYRRLVD